MSLKQKIFDLISRSASDLDDKDIKPLEEEYQKVIDLILSKNSFNPVIYIKNPPIKEKSHFPFFNPFKKEDVKENNLPLPRTVVIGDIHCDFNSLSGIFRKLSVSEYSYFDHAIFVFLGDYIDRGLWPFQTLRFILGLKELLQERCILLRGNHDHIKFNEAEKKLYSEVRPAETVEFFNQYLPQEAKVRILNFFNSLPFMAVLKRNEKNILLVHASIPRDEHLETFDLDKIIELKYSDQENKENKVVKMIESMLWGDPTNVKFKMNGTSTRFEFGSEQFANFIKKSTFTHLFRGHEPVEYGIKEMYDKKLYTVFSSGGLNNEQSYYNDSVPYPGFVIIDEEGNILQENIFTYKIKISQKDRMNEPKKSNKHLLETEQLAPYSFLIESDLIFEKEQPIADKLATNLKLNSEFVLNIKTGPIPDFLDASLSKMLFQFIKT